MATETGISLKLLIDGRGKRLVFAEAGKDFVDFLFGILSLPVSTVVSLIGKEKMDGSLANLHESVENMNDSYILPNKRKDKLLKPVSGFPFVAGCAEPPVKGSNRCTCIRSSSYFYGEPICLYCCKRKSESYGQTSGGGETGVVKGLISYIVMDDLTVMPLSTNSTITMLNKMNVKSVGALEEKVVHLGIDEAVKLLNASLQSKSVLSDVFLKQEKSDERTAVNVKCEESDQSRKGIKRERTYICLN